jgi:hypothetical protein
MQNYRWIMNWNRCGRKRSWPILRYYPGLCLKEWWRPIEGLCHVSWCFGWDSKHEPPEYISKYYHLKTTRLLYGCCYYHQIKIRIRLCRVLAKLNPVASSEAPLQLLLQYYPNTSFPAFPNDSPLRNLSKDFFYCCIVHLDNIKITFTNECTF